MKSQTSKKKTFKLNRIVFRDKQDCYEIEDIVSITQFNGGIVVITKDGTVYAEKPLKS